MTKIMLLTSMFAALGAASPANAHAMLDRADPRVGSTVDKAPKEIVMWFTEQLEPAFSRAEVRNEAGVHFETGKPRVSGSSRAELHVPVNSMPPGTYRVFWRVLSVDTHRTEGSFSFRVGP